MCCGKLNRRIWEEKSAQLWGLRAFTIGFATRTTLRKGANLLEATLQKGAILPRSGLHLPAGQGCGRLPVPTACADRLCQPATCLCRLRVPTCWRAAGPDAGRGRLVELVLDEELDGLVFCHSEFVVEDCGVVVSLLCAEPEFSLV